MTNHSKIKPGSARVGGGAGKPTKAQDIQRIMADDIVHGRMLPGSALDETGAAERFGVSRTPIREAIRQLEAVGLVEVRAHRGAVVANVSEAALDDMFAVMAELEGLCARWSARAMTATERRDLDSIHRQAATYVGEGRCQDYAAVNDRFHEALYQGAHSPFLAQLTRSVRLRLAPFRRAQFATLGRLAQSHKEHGLILAAIAAADVDQAYRTMRAHIVVVRSAVEAIGHLEAASPRPRPGSRPNRKRT